MKISGEGRYIDTTGRQHKVEGIGSFPDKIPLQGLNVSGKLLFEKISCDKIKVSGECCGDSLTAKKISVEGTLKVDSINVEETLRLEGELKVTDIEAEDISIESKCGIIGNIRCNRIKVFDNSDFPDGRRSRVHIQNLTADTVELENCTVELIRCREAHIGTNCVIEKLFVAGECKVAADSTVSETIRT